MRNQLFIDGQFADAADGATIDAVSPRDGAVLAKVAAAGHQDVDRAVAAARRAFDAGVWSGISPRHRKKVMLKFADLIRENAGELAELETLDVGSLHPAPPSAGGGNGAPAGCRRLTAQSRRTPPVTPPPPAPPRSRRTPP